MASFRLIQLTTLGLTATFRAGVLTVVGLFLVKLFWLLAHPIIEKMLTKKTNIRDMILFMIQ